MLKNVFDCPEYWLSKGFEAHTGENKMKMKKKTLEECLIDDTY
jgi:hypothetical protein